MTKLSARAKRRALDRSKHVTEVVEYKGKLLPVYKYIKQKAKDLPAMVDKEENPVDHEKMLKAWYKEKGREGVIEYLTTLKEIVENGAENNIDGLVRGAEPEQGNKREEEGQQ